VLLIDDELVIRTALRRFFARRGWLVEEASDGDAARRLLEARDAADAFDLVICDLRMPRLSGADLYAWLAESHPDALGRLVLSSGDVLSADAAGFLARSQCPVLAKPFELAELARIVEAVCGEAVLA
jgi:DNA-binding response OmpR family regulator